MSEPFADAELIDRIRSGSRVAFDSLMRRHERTVFRVAWSYTRDSDEAMDLCQDVFVKVYRRLDSYRGEGPFLGWLLRITHREGIDWVRRSRISGGVRAPVEIDQEAADTPQEEDLFRRERTEWLMNELTRLNPKQRTALTLRYFEEMPVARISEILGCSDGTARNILFRGLRKLRDRWAASAGGEDEQVSPLSGTNLGSRGR